MRAGGVAARAEAADGAPAATDGVSVGIASRTLLTGDTGVASEPLRSSCTRLVPGSVRPQLRGVVVVLAPAAGGGLLAGGDGAAGGGLLEPAATSMLLGGVHCGTTHAVRM